MKLLSFGRIDEGQWHQVAVAISSGGLVCLPTDTVYGLACDPNNSHSLGRLYEVKGRPSDKPVSLMFADAGQLRSGVAGLAAGQTDRQTAGLLDIAGRLLDYPVTVILPTESGTIGVRAVPGRYAQAYGELPLPLAMTSANRSGEREPASLDQVPDPIKDACEFVIDDGPCRLGEPTTVVDLTPMVSGDCATIIRQGAFSRSEVEKLVGECA